MSGLAGVLGKPRTRDYRLKNGAEVTIRELSIADAWPYVNGQAVDPEALIRASVVDIDAGETITLAIALELLPIILEFNNLTGDGDTVDAPNFPRAASSE